MRPVSREAFRTDAIDTFVAGERWAYFGLTPTLLGYAIWGRPEPRDIEALVALLTDELARPLHDVLIDFSALEHVEASVFESLARYAITHCARLQEIVTRAAIVRPPGVAGAVVTGFFELAARPFQVIFVDDVDRGAALFHYPPVAETMLALRRPNLIAALRVALAADVVAPDRAAIAKALGLSQRTLQRRLEALGTTLARELQHVRLDAAAHALRDGDTPISRVALDHGFATSQQFATAFRAVYGLTPTAYRQR